MVDKKIYFANINDVTGISHSALSFVFVCLTGA